MVKKNVAKSDWIAISRIVRRRTAQGRPSQVIINRKHVPEKKLKKEIQRYRGATSAFARGWSLCQFTSRHWLMDACSGLVEPTFSSGLAVEISTPPMGATDPNPDAGLDQDLEYIFDLDVEEIGNVALSHPTNMIPTGVETLQFTLPIRAFAASINSRVTRSSGKNPSQCPPH
jgi:hypothetical protein